MGWWNRRFRDVRQCLMDPSRNGRQDCRFRLNGFAGEKLQVLPYIVGHKIPGFRVHLLALNTLLDISCPLRISQTKIQPGPYNVDILEGGKGYIHLGKTFSKIDWFDNFSLIYLWWKHVETMRLLKLPHQFASPLCIFHLTPWLGQDNWRWEWWTSKRLAGPVKTVG